MELKDKTYLGDSVYAGHDGCQIWVWLSNGMGEEKHIAMEPEVIAALIQYAKRLGMM